VQRQLRYIKYRVASESVRTLRHVFFAARPKTGKVLGANEETN
jgi:hypothetical protein